MSTGHRFSDSAYLIHRRPYRETSYILELLTKEHGRVSAVYKGGRKPAKRRVQAEPFVQYQVSLVGRSELKILSNIEVDEGFGVGRLQGVQLFSGLYVNELLHYLLPERDPFNEIYRAYEDIMLALHNTTNFEAHLRHFELKLLSALGYATNFDLEADGETPISESNRYSYVPGQGFSPISTGALSAANIFSVSGEVLVCIAEGQWQETNVQRALKRINQAAIDQLLKGRPLRSRDYYRSSIRR